MLYSSPAVVPPMYIQGHFPWDGPGRPLSANANLFSQLMGYGPGAVPVSSLHPGSDRSGSACQSSGDELPRYRSGTGTYLPNPKISSRDRQSSNARNNGGNYSNDCKDHLAERDLYWNVSSRQRFSGRDHGRNQIEKPNSRIARSIASNNRSDKPLDSFRFYVSHSNHSQNGPISSSNSSRHAFKNVSHGMYPLPVMNPNGVSPSVDTVPSVFMFDPYDQNMGCPPEQLEFGSFGPTHFSNINEVVQRGEISSKSAEEQQNYLLDSGHSSPDLPSAPKHKRGFKLFCRMNT